MKIAFLYIFLLGLSDKWRMEASLFNKKHELLAHRSPASLLILRKYKYDKNEPLPTLAKANEINLR